MSTEDQNKGRQKAEKKRMKQLVGTMSQAFSDVQNLLGETRQRLVVARQAVAAFDGETDAPTEAMRAFLADLDLVLQKAEHLSDSKGQDAEQAICEHYFPGRAAKWAAEDEEQFQDRRTAQSEQYAGYSRG